MNRSKIQLFVVFFLVFVMLPIYGHASIVARGTCGDNVNWTLSDKGLLKITGEGEITNPSWNGDDLRNVIIEDGIIGICDGAFYHCSRIESISFPTEMEYIGSHAFNGCESLRSLILPEGITHLPICSFFGCGRITELQLPSTLEYIGEMAFSGCSSLPSLVFPENMVEIGINAFANCFGFTHVSFSGSLTRIRENGFSYCTNMRSIILPEGLEYIDDRAFRACWGLKKVYIPNSVKEIGIEAFRECRTLERLSIPDSVNYIGADAFHENTILLCNHGSYAEKWAKTNGTIAHTDVHSVTVTAAIKPTETDTGLSEGVYCSVCGRDIVTRKVIPSLNELTVLKLPSKLKTIESEAFADLACEAVIIPSSCKTIKSHAFQNCCNLSYVQIPSSVTNLASDAFDDYNVDLIIIYDD